MNNVVSTNRISSGVKSLDVLLDGGLEPGSIFALQSRLPEVARHACAWFWSVHTMLMGHRCGIVLTEGDAFGNLLAQHSNQITTERGISPRAALDGIKIARLGMRWEPVIEQFGRHHTATPVDIIVVDSIPTYRADRDSESARRISIDGLTALARTLDVPVLAVDQDPREIDDSEIVSLEIVDTGGRFAIRRRGRPGLGVELPMTPKVVAALSQRRKPDFLTGPSLFS